MNMNKHEIIGCLNKQLLLSIIGKIEERFNTKAIDIRFYHHYFIFSGKKNSKIRFQLDGIKDFDFAIWINGARLRKGIHLTYDSIDFFGEFEEFIDKFKPSRTYFSQEIDKELNPTIHIDKFIKELLDKQEYKKHFLNSLHYNDFDYINIEDLLNRLNCCYSKEKPLTFDEHYDLFFTKKELEKQKEEQSLIEFKHLCCELSKDENVLGIGLAEQYLSYPDIHISIEHKENTNIDDIKDKIRRYKFYNYSHGAYIENTTTVDNVLQDDKYSNDYFTYLSSEVFKKDSFYEYSKINIYSNGVEKEFSIE